MSSGARIRKFANSLTFTSNSRVHILYLSNKDIMVRIYIYFFKSKCVLLIFTILN